MCKDLNKTKESEITISEVFYRLFWYVIFLIVPYLFISFFAWDITWIVSEKLENLPHWKPGFNPIRMLFGVYGVIVFIPCVLLGVYTPKGMKKFDNI